MVPCALLRVVQCASLQCDMQWRTLLMATDDDITDDDFRAALDREEFFLVFQPTIDLQGGAFVGVEALLRWRTSGRVLGPADFLARLEATGAIAEVGTWVLRTACERGAEWHAKGHRFWVSVNVSPGQLAAPGFAAALEEALDASGFAPSHLVVEFPGASLRDAAGPLAAAKGLGVRLCIDDFGADPDVAAALPGAPVDMVKIDRSLVAGLGSEAGSDRVRELVELGRELHLETVAQGIEDDDQRLALRGEHVDAGQGYLLSVPHTASELDHLLEDYAIFSGRPL